MALNTSQFMSLSRLEKPTNRARCNPAKSAGDIGERGAAEGPPQKTDYGNAWRREGSRRDGMHRMENFNLISSMLGRGAWINANCFWPVFMLIRFAGPVGAVDSATVLRAG